jgi:hypothetical protein
LPGEGIELLDTGDGRVFDALIGTVLVESSINLSSAKDDTVNLVGVVDGVTVLWVRDDPLELGITSELLDRRAGERMAEERLGEEEDQSCEKLAFFPSLGTERLTFSELSVHLSSQDVKQIRWGCHVSNLHIAILMLTVKLVRRWEDSGILVAQLKISFHTTGRMFRSLSIVSVR